MVFEQGCSSKSGILIVLSSRSTEMLLSYSYNHLCAPDRLNGPPKVTRPVKDETPFTSDTARSGLNHSTIHAGGCAHQGGTKLSSRHFNHTPFPQIVVHNGRWSLFMVSLPSLCVSVPQNSFNLIKEVHLSVLGDRLPVCYQ